MRLWTASFQGWKCTGRQAMFKGRLGGAILAEGTALAGLAPETAEKEGTVQTNPPTSLPPHLPVLGLWKHLSGSRTTTVGLPCRTEAEAAVGWMGMKDVWHVPRGSLMVTLTITLLWRPNDNLRIRDSRSAAYIGLRLQNLASGSTPRQGHQAKAASMLRRPAHRMSLEVGKVRIKMLRTTG